MSASSEVATREGMDIACRCRMHPQCARAHTRTHACVRVLARVHRRRDPIIAPEAKQWQDRDNRWFMCLYFFMNVGEFVERREAVKELVGVDKLLILHISPSSLEYSHT